MKEHIAKVLQDNKKILDRLARHDSGEDIIDTSNIEKAMNRQEKLTKIESVIREVCPELQELTFGCVAHIRSGNCLNKYVINCIHHDTDGTKRYKVSCLDNKLFNPEDFTEIIGHPIHLEHILRAIRTTITMAHIDVLGRVFEHGKYVCEFNLTLPLHLQSDEFINWLYGVLVGDFNNQPT